MDRLSWVWGDSNPSLPFVVTLLLLFLLLWNIYIYIYISTLQEDFAKQNVDD